MNIEIQESCELLKKRCVPCEGGIPKYSLEEAQQQIANHPEWQISHDGCRISREWTSPNFMAAIDFFNRVAELAEAENLSSIGVPGLILIIICLIPVIILSKGIMKNVRH